MNPAFLVIKGIWMKYRIFWILGIVASLMSLSAFYTARYKEGQHALREQRQHELFQEEYEKRQTQYENDLKRLTEEALRKQEDLSKLNTELEKKYHDSKHQADLANRKYDRLVRNGFRLRDPKATSRSVQVCGEAKSPDSRATNSSHGSPSGTELSEETTRDLLRLARDADRVVEQLRIVQEYAQELRLRCSQ